MNSAALGRVHGRAVDSADMRSMLSSLQFWFGCPKWTSEDVVIPFPAIGWQDLSGQFSWPSLKGRHLGKAYQRNPP